MPTFDVVLDINKLAKNLGNCLYNNLIFSQNNFLLILAI